MRSNIPVNTSNENRCKRDRRRDKIEAEPLIMQSAKPRTRHLLAALHTGLVIPANAQRKVQREGVEEGHSSDLDSDAGDDHLVADIDQVARASSQTSSSGLRKDAHCVEADEDPGIQSRRQSGVLPPKHHSQMLQGQVDTCGEETRRQDEQHDLQFKAAARPGILVHQQPPAVACCFHSTGDSGYGAEGAQLVFDSQAQLEQRADAENNTQEDVAAEVWVVAVGRGLDRALRRHLCAEAARHLGGAMVVASRCSPSSPG